MSRATLRARLGVTAASLGLAVTSAIAVVPTAHATTRSTATTHHHHHRAMSAAKRHRLARIRHHNREVKRVLRIARYQRGKPYVYGADGPHAFDCSGLVRYVFGHAVDRWLPHNAAAQYHSLHRIGRGQVRPGDLVFVDNGYVSHVGIYAGHHNWWVAPHTGARVHLQHIYPAHHVYARVLNFRHR
jgi:cell wall-associated NlpC family hydrolase